MTARLASSLHAGDVFRFGDWNLHATADAHYDNQHRVEVTVAEFPFPVHLEWFELVDVLERQQAVLRSGKSERSSD